MQNGLIDAEALGNARAALGRLMRDCRAASASAARAEQALGGDVFGRATVGAGQEVDEGELVELVQLARAEYPEHQLIVTVIASPPARQRGARREETHGNAQDT